MKRILVLCAIVASSAGILPLAAQSSIWLGFENGKKMFREGDYSEALIAFREAVAARRDTYGNALQKLDSALSSTPARSAGDSMAKVIFAFAERDFIASEIAALEKEAAGSFRKKLELIRMKRIADSFRNFIDALEIVLDETPVSVLRDSVAALRYEVVRLKSFPEAEYWIGLVFMQEGEYELARMQFERAESMADSYRVPDDRFTVLYTLSFVYRTAGKMRDYEMALLEIADADPLFSDQSRQYLRTRMMETLIEAGPRAGFDKFISLYRLKSAFALRAFDELGSYYLDSNRDDRALLYLAAAVDIVAANIVESVKSDDPSFVYTTMADLLGRSMPKPEIRSYVESVDLFRLMFRLGVALERKNALAPARSIYSVVAAEGAAGIWRDKSRSRLSR
ncbi:MAG: hypothetical protein NT080_13605 [Spirochaetes bacterium]|nr:hypothetical protein [Spirochaetota bacterium]